MPDGFGTGRGRRGQPPETCVCPQCGYETAKALGTPCRSIKCPKCGSLLMGK